MFKEKLMLRLIAVALLFTSALAATPADKPIGYLEAALGLEASQIASIRDARENRNFAIELIKPSLVANRTALREELAKDSPDPAVVGDLFLKIRADEKRIGEVKAEYTRAARSFLNQDQLKKLRRLRSALKVQAAAKQAVSWGLIKAPRTKK
jgi:hypothetical protein